MNANDVVLDVVRAFDELAIRYMVDGSYSSNLYGRPRSTKDADFVIQCTDAAIGALRHWCDQHETRELFERLLIESVL